MLSTILLATIIQALPRDYLADVVKELKKDWPANRMVEVVCHGHSVPAGFFKTPEIQAQNAYPNLLRMGLNQRFPHAVINVTVTAIGGENSISGEKRFARDVLGRHPDVVTIDYSLNDRGQDRETVHQAWISMIKQARAQNIKVILLTPTPDQSAKMDDPNDPINRQADDVRAIAKEQGVGLIDSLAEFKKAIKAGTPLPSLMSQVNHPNREGHTIVANELLRWFPAN
ncbi:MAG: SGNH/GDSL hydrolase family protein [Armatimonadota bacterium]